MMSVGDDDMPVLQVSEEVLKRIEARRNKKSNINNNNDNNDAIKQEQHNVTQQQQPQNNEHTANASTDTTSSQQPLNNANTNIVATNTSVEIPTLEKPSTVQNTTIISPSVTLTKSDSSLLIKLQRDYEVLLSKYEMQQTQFIKVTETNTCLTNKINEFQCEYNEFHKTNNYTLNNNIFTIEKQKQEITHYELLSKKQENELNYLREENELLHNQLNLHKNEKLIAVKQIDELNAKFNKLTVKYNNLLEQYNTIEQTNNENVNKIQSINEENEWRENKFKLLVNELRSELNILKQEKQQLTQEYATQTATLGKQLFEQATQVQKQTNNTLSGLLTQVGQTLSVSTTTLNNISAANSSSNALLDNTRNEINRKRKEKQAELDKKLSAIEEHYNTNNHAHVTQSKPTVVEDKVPIKLVENKPAAVVTKAAEPVVQAVKSKPSASNEMKPKVKTPKTKNSNKMRDEEDNEDDHKEDEDSYEPDEMDDYNDDDYSDEDYKANKKSKKTAKLVNNKRAKAKSNKSKPNEQTKKSTVNTSSPVKKAGDNIVIGSSSTPPMERNSDMLTSLSLSPIHPHTATINNNINNINHVVSSNANNNNVNPNDISTASSVDEFGQKKRKLFSKSNDKDNDDEVKETKINKENQSNTKAVSNPVNQPYKPPTTSLYKPIALTSTNYASRPILSNLTNSSTSTSNLFMKFLSGQAAQTMKAPKLKSK